jgi:hypothetical protein
VPQKDVLCSHRNSGIGTLSNIALTAQLRVDEDAFISSDQARLTAEGNAILAQKLLDVWAWCFFAVNTTMTMSIIYKILYVSCFDSNLPH